VSAILAEAQRSVSSGSRHPRHPISVDTRNREDSSRDENRPRLVAALSRSLIEYTPNPGRPINPRSRRRPRTNDRPTAGRRFSERRAGNVRFPSRRTDGEERVSPGLWGQIGPMGSGGRRGEAEDSARGRQTNRRSEVGDLSGRQRRRTEVAEEPPLAAPPRPSVWDLTVTESSDTGRKVGKATKGS